MIDFRRSLDEEIQRAMRAGAFDNLPGKGKPLNLGENPHEDPAWRMAYWMLRSSGHTLPWIEKRQDIETEVEAARLKLARSWAWMKSEEAQELAAAVVKQEWDRALGLFVTKLQELNKRIFDYNLEAPSYQFRCKTLRADREIEKIINQSN